jgi:hypothetical protein
MYYGLDNKEVRYIINIIKGSYDETK